MRDRKRLSNIPETAIDDEPSYCIPEQKSSERLLALLVFVITLAYLLLFRRYTDLDPDEGIVLAGAERILRGQVLYRDFFSFFTPGSYYFLAGLFRLFGSSFLLARTALALMGGVISLTTYLLARRACSRGVALLVAGLVSLTCLPYRFLVLHNWDSTLWAGLALYCAVRWMESSKIENGKAKSGKGSIFEFRFSIFDPALWALAAGSFASLTFLFEQSKGAGLIVGLGVGLMAIGSFRRPAAGGPAENRKSETENSNSETGNSEREGRSPQSQPRKANPQPPSSAFRLLPSAYWFLAGLAWPIVLTFLYFSAKQSLSPMLADWFWPLGHYSRANRVPYGYQNWSESAVHSLFFSGPWLERVVATLTLSPCILVPVLPLFSCGLLVYWFSRRRDKSDAKRAYYVLINATLAGLLLSVVLVRADIVHFMYLGPLFYLVLAWVMDGRDIPIFPTARPFLSAFLVVAFGLLAMPLLLRNIRTPFRVESRRGTITTPGKDTVIDFVQAHIPPGGEVLVYPYLPLYYYLTGTRSPTRYEYFQPGMHTRQQAREMVSELAVSQVGVVLLETSFVDKIPTSWPGTPLAAIADDQVVDYIVQNYRACRLLKSPSGWRFLYMTRKALICPDETSGR